MVCSSGLVRLLTELNDLGTEFNGFRGLCGRIEYQTVPPKLLKAVSVADRFRRTARSVQSTLTELKSKP